MGRNMLNTIFVSGVLLLFLSCNNQKVHKGIAIPGKRDTIAKVSGLTGKIYDTKIAVDAPSMIAPLSAGLPHNDIDMVRMAQWAMNYLIRTPRKELNYEPVFQCRLYGCPPIPSGHDPIVEADTDTRLNWEWYFMRQVSGSTSGEDIEKAFHRRILDYVQDDGTVIAHPGSFNESETNRVWKKDEYLYHIWGATKILYAMAEDYRRTGNEQSKQTGRKIMLRLKRLAIYPTPDKCYLAAGMGGVKLDGTPVPNFWNKQPAPLVESLVNFYLATGDQESLVFAKAYADGIIDGLQPDGIRFKEDGSFEGHGHATMHALWGIGHLGLITGEPRYLDFVKQAWDYYLRLGTGTGWFPAMKDYPGDETCCLSDMMSNAAMIAWGGHPEYFDYIERYMRNIISNRQFVITPEFEANYRKINVAHSEKEITSGLATLQKFQGAVLTFSGLNEWENDLLGSDAYPFQLAGCCAAEGMRAIYTTWLNVIKRIDHQSNFGPKGVYVNMCLNRDSEWGRVVSFFPEMGRITVRSKVKDVFFLRPPHWAPRDSIRAFVGSKQVPVIWSGDYVRFDAVNMGDELTITYPLIEFTHEVEGLWKTKPDLKLTYKWLGNMVVSVDPPPAKTPLFLGKPRLLPPWNWKEK